MHYATVICYALNVVEEILYPKLRNFIEAMESKESQKWMQVVNEEIESMDQKQTWKHVDLPNNQRVVRCKWIFKKEKKKGRYSR